MKKPARPSGTARAVMDEEGGLAPGESYESFFRLPFVGSEAGAPEGVVKFRFYTPGGHFAFG